MLSHDAVNHPKHYTNGVPEDMKPILSVLGVTEADFNRECIDVIWERFSLSFNVGNAVKYLWRAGQKGDKIEDLKKARWYLQYQLDRMPIGAIRFLQQLLFFFLGREPIGIKKSTLQLVIQMLDLFVETTQKVSLTTDKSDSQSV